MEIKKQYVTFKMDFDEGIVSNVSVADSREQAVENIRKAVEKDIATEFADYDEVDEDWKDSLLSQVNRMAENYTNMVNDSINNVAYYMRVADND